MQEITTECMVRNRKDAKRDDEQYLHLKRPHSPCLDTVPYKLQTAYGANKAFHSRQGPGLVKVIWTIQDFEAIGTESNVRNNQTVSPWFEAANSSKWRIVLCHSPERTHLSIFLETNTQTNAFPQDAHYSFTVQMVKLNNKLEKIISKSSKDSFSLEHPMIGYLNSVSVDKLKPHQSKAIHITSTVKTVANREICKKITGFVGLINEGTTCYMNSLLQTLYLITSFRKAIYSIPISDSEEFKIPKALAKLFASMQISEKPLSTQALLKSFGWARDKWHEQQDVQEFSYIFSGTLEKSMNATQVSGTYSQLFKGQTVQKIRCLKIDHESEKCEDFIDLQLDVKGCANIYASLDKYIEPVLLNGEIQYEAEGHGKQDAVKIVRFKKLPSVLQIQLKRFEYNQTRGMMTKVNEKFEFYSEINLNPYAVVQSEDNIYKLFSIMVHSGTLGKGHYSSFISPRLDENWFQFNDETVDTALSKQAIEVNWGGEIEDIMLTDGGVVIQGKKKCDTSAYMLVYIRMNEKAAVLPLITDAEIPAKLTQPEKFEETKPRESRRVTRSSCFKVALATKETIAGWEGAGIASFSDQSSFLIYEVRKNYKFQDFIDTKLAFITDVRLWTFSPVPVGWKFQEVTPSDLLSSCSITEEVTTAIFIDSKHKVFTGSPGSWSWNTQESASINGKQENGKILTHIKKFEKNSTKIVGSEWVNDSSVADLRKRLFDKYFDSGTEGWVCIERCNSEEVKIEEVYAFYQMKKKGKNVLLENGDALVIGVEQINVPKEIQMRYDSLNIEAVYFDCFTFFEFKSYSKKLYEVTQFPSSLTVDIKLSYTKIQVIKEIHKSLGLNMLPISSIQILSASHKPVPETGFFVSKILMNGKLLFDIFNTNSQDDSVIYLTIIEFSQDYTPIRSFFKEINRDSMVKDLLRDIGEGFEAFTFKYQQRAILNLIPEDDTVQDMGVGVVYGVRKRCSALKRKEKRLFGFHAFSIDQGTAKPFEITIKRSDTCADIKKEIIKKFNCTSEIIKVVQLNNLKGSQAFKIFCDLEESSDEFWYKYENCSLMIEHKHQGMRFN